MNVYEWANRINERVELHEDNVKIIMLYDKWRYVRSDNSDDGTR
jgi:hypothetical protein